jgi:hypothetical protein
VDVGNILRRVAIVVGLVSALVFSWIHRVETPISHTRLATAPVAVAQRDRDEEIEITPGKRAVSFRVNDVSGIAGLIQPNSRVDIVVVLDSGAEQGRVAKVLMENMRILAMNAVSQRSEDGRPINAAVATVEVTPSEGEQLAVAMRQGQIQLMLRGNGDPESVTTRGPTARLLPFIRPQLRRPDTHTVTIYRQGIEQRPFGADSARRDSVRARP